MTTSAPTQSPLQSVLTLFAFLVIISIGIWGAITAFKLFPRMSEVFSSLFSRSTETALVITSDLSIPSGSEYALNWKHDGNDAGVYAFSYECTDGVRVEAPVAAGGVLGPITCGISYGVPGTERSLTIVPTSDNTAEMPITLSYTNSDGEKLAIATSTLTITSGSTAHTPATTTPTKTVAATAPTSVKTGTLPSSAPTVTTSPADLEPTLIAIGIEDPYSGTFIPQSQFTQSDVVVVKFSVKNRGGRATGAWSFTAELPTNPPYYYEAPSQRSLNPGDWNEFTLRFNQAAGGSIFINIDAADAVKEANKNNNTLTIDVPQYWY